MIRGLIGKKVGMTQIFDEDGKIFPVTVVEMGPCMILKLKNSPMKVTLGFDPIKETKVNKPLLGFFKKIGVPPMRVIKEFLSSDNTIYKIGQEIKADFFQKGDFVDVQGVSIGKGFQGGMKRWNWDGGPQGHGSMHHRRVGSIGASADPSRTLRGTNMPGQMGGRKSTVQGLRVLGIDIEENLILIKGGIPGHAQGTVFVSRSQKKKFKSLDEKQVAVAHKVNPMKQSKAKAKGKR